MSSGGTVSDRVIWYISRIIAKMKLRRKEQEAFVQGISRGDFLIVDGYVLLGDLNN